MNNWHRDGVVCQAMLVSARALPVRLQLVQVRHDSARRDEMSELVYENQYSEYEQKRQDCRHAFNSSAWALCRAHSRDQ